MQQDDLFSSATKSENTPKKCPHCGASMKMYWHRLTPVLARSLVKAYSFVSGKGENKFDKKDLNLSHSEYGNFQKLRFHGLIAKYKEDGVWKKGQWLITRRGAQFLKGQISVPKRVQTFRNKVVDHDFDQVNVKQVIGSYPFVETEFDYDLFSV